MKKLLSGLVLLLCVLSVYGEKKSDELPGPEVFMQFFDRELASFSNPAVTLLLGKVQFPKVRQKVLEKVTKDYKTSAYENSVKEACTVLEYIKQYHEASIEYVAAGLEEHNYNAEIAVPGQKKRVSKEAALQEKEEEFIEWLSKSSFHVEDDRTEDEKVFDGIRELVNSWESKDEN